MKHKTLLIATISLCVFSVLFTGTSSSEPGNNYENDKTIIPEQRVEAVINSDSHVEIATAGTIDKSVIMHKVFKTKVSDFAAYDHKGSNSNVTASEPFVGNVKAVIVPDKNIETQKEILFYDDAGTIKKRLALDKEKQEKGVFSRYKKYLVVGGRSGEYTSAEGGMLFNSDGDLLWKSDKGEVPVDVSDEGYFIGEIQDRAPYPPVGFTFFDNEGERIETIHNPYLKSGHGYGIAKYIGKGKYAVVGFTKHEDINSTTIIITDNTGNELRKKEFGCAMFYEEDGITGNDTIGIAGILRGCDKYKDPHQVESSLFFMDLMGNIDWETPLEMRGENVVRIFDDEGKIFVSSVFGYVWCFDSSSGKFIWRYKADWAKNPEEELFSRDIPFFPLFYQMEITKQNVYIACRYEKVSGEWNGSEVTILDAGNGEFNKRIEFRDRKIMLRMQDRKPVFFDLDNGEVIVIKQEVESQ